MSNAIRRYVTTIAVLGPASILVIIFGILGGADRIGYELPSLEPVDASSVDRIVIERPSESVSLHRSPTGWLVSPGNFAAHIPSVQFLLGAMTDLNITDVVSIRDDPARYDLDTEQRLRVTLQGSGGDLLVVDIGRRAATYGHTYVSVPGDNRILQAAGELRAAFDRGVDALRDRRVLSFAPEDITGIELTLDDGITKVVRAARTDEGWIRSVEAEVTAAGNPVLDQGAIDAVLGFLAGFSAYRFRYDDPLSGEPWLTMRITGDDDAHTLEIYDAEGSLYPARTSGSDYEFDMFSFQADLILEPFGLGPDQEDVLAEPGR